MKKLYLLIFSVVSFLGISSVSADTLTLSDYSNNYDNDVAYYLSHETIINNLIDMWEQNLSMQYPYYFINYASEFTDIRLYYFDTPYLYLYYKTYSNGNLTYAMLGLENYFNSYIQFYNNTYSIVPPSTSGGTYPAYLQYGSFISSRPANYNSLPLVNHGMKFKADSTYTSLTFPGFTSSTYSQTISSMVVNNGDLLPDIASIYNGTYSPEDSDSYTEINLNDYEYIILSLKSYTPIDTQYSSTIYVNGSLCATPVYNYGMKEKKEYYSGYQVQGCTEYYNQLTPVNFYILPQDVSNHAVYYIKSDNTYVTNLIKVDNDIFDITYVTSENSNNPSVTIGGRSYPTIPYNNLTDTAIISTEQGYISGQVCAVGDVNCYYESTGIDISDLFSNPLKLLKSVWGSITTMFVLISTFIALLPPTLQAFTFSAFMLAIVLGVLKIIL